MNNPLLLMLEHREKYLRRIIEEKNRDLRDAPEGSLRVSGTGDHVQFYQVPADRQKKERYLGKKDIELVRALAQKDYDKKVVQAAEEELRSILVMKRMERKDLGESLFHKLHLARRELITPIRLPDDLYVKRWLQEPYEKKGFSDDAPRFYTDDNVRVRSKSELMIANQLLRKGVPYLYEKPLTLNGVTLHPDFTVLNVRTRRAMYWEHFGMMDNDEYYEHAIWRLRLYESCGLFPGDGVLVTFEMKKLPLETDHIRTMIEHYLL